MKTFKDYIKDNYNLTMPEPTVSGGWFVENGFPMIVACTCCGMTMALPSAMIDDDGQCYCSSCAE